MSFSTPSSRHRIPDHRREKDDLVHETGSHGHLETQCTRMKDNWRQDPRTLRHGRRRIPAMTATPVEAKGGMNALDVLGIVGHRRPLVVRPPHRSHTNG